MTEIYGRFNHKSRITSYELHIRRDKIIKSIDSWKYFILNGNIWHMLHEKNCSILRPINTRIILKDQWDTNKNDKMKIAKKYNIRVYKNAAYKFIIRKRHLIFDLISFVTSTEISAHWKENKIF